MNSISKLAKVTLVLLTSLAGLSASAGVPNLDPVPTGVPMVLEVIACTMPRVPSPDEFRAVVTLGTDVTIEFYTPYIQAPLTGTCSKAPNAFEGVYTCYLPVPGAGNIISYEVKVASTGYREYDAQYTPLMYESVAAPTAFESCITIP